MTKYRECFTCRLVECDEKDCKSPHCYARCRKKFTFQNVIYEFCKTCDLVWERWLKKSVPYTPYNPGNLPKKRLRVEQ